MHLNRAWIEGHIPHQGRMCLLDEVIDWNAEHIRCRTNTHRMLDNPLRSQDRLGIACGIEYVAQAMALHGALSGGSADSMEARPAPSLGLLASVRDVHLYAVRLDDIESDLICTASLLAGDNFTALYEFAMQEVRGILLTGRASVVLDAVRHVKYE
jgi:predicted hotdog family 3-hydroxylacyl-ACP dehydratase